VNTYAHAAIGSGPPLVLLPGLTASHEPPTGFQNRIQAASMRRAYKGVTTHWIGRPIGLPEDTTMADLARYAADAIRSRFDGPVPVLGSSTGGCVALQLAADHPEVVSKLVVLVSACRLDPTGKRVQREVARLVRAGRWRSSFSAMTEALAPPGPGQVALGAVMWLLAPALFGVPEDPSDMLATIEAEDAFDLCDRLGEIRAPTLVAAGDADRFYGEEIRRTADGIPGARLVLAPGKGHLQAATDKELVREMLAFVRD
jgi:pimeloyl-ACP methyl ester carboxylesterase